VLDKIADFLFEKETITGKEFMEIFHEVKGTDELKETDTGASEEADKKAESSEGSAETAFTWEASENKEENTEE